jgi:hypothetical protein
MKSMSRERRYEAAAVKEDGASTLLEELLGAAISGRSETQGRETRAAQILVGEVVDTHHPDLPGHVFVSWTSDRGDACTRWLAYVRGHTPRKGDRVLLQQPANWPEMLVTAIIEGASFGRPVMEEASATGPTLKLPDHERLRIDSASGHPLVEVYGSSQGPVVRLLNQDVTLDIAGKFRLRADTLELEGGNGGIDCRTEADVIVRGRFIRIN